MKKIIKAFKKSEEKILEIEHKKKSNTLYEWTKIISPHKLIWNTTIIKICKYLPLHAKTMILKNVLKLNIGKNVGIAPETTMDYCHPELITIEDDVLIGMKSDILCHEFLHNKIRIGRVILKKGCLIGAFTKIRSGVTIGENSIVAMASFVNKDIPPNEIWGGVPAKFIKKNK